MKKTRILLPLVLCLLLAGCGWMDGSYVHISDHYEKNETIQEQILTASGYLELENVLSRMVQSGISEGLIYLTDYPEEMAESGMYVVSRWLTSKDPVGAYAVKSVDYEVGSNSGKPAISVKFDFRHTPMEIQQIRHAEDTQHAEEILGRALEAVAPGVVILIREYEPADFIQMVTDFALEHPQTVMEIPHTTQIVYGSEESRIVELNFTYRTSRDSLKLMRSHVEPVFEAAKLYISEDVPELQQYAQLCSFLMERFDYRVQSSITPSYSLLHHGVGDSSAFATVYRAMCRSVGLDCKVLSGTRGGEPWTWNIIGLNGHYSHVDLLRCGELGSFYILSPEELQDYVWDYSAGPENVLPQDPAEEASAETPEASEPGAEPEASEQGTEPESLPSGSTEPMGTEEISAESENNP